MIRIIWNAFLLGVIGLAAAWLSNNPGAVRIEWIGYQVQTSVAVVIALVIIVYAVCYTFLAKPVLYLREKMFYWFGADKRAQKIARSKIDREVDRYTLLGRGLTALAAGDIPAAEKLQKQIEKSFAGDKAKTMVFQAQLAEAKNDTPEAMRLYGELAADPSTRLLGMRGKIRLLRLNGSPEKALDLCSKLLNEKHPPMWVLSEAFELQIQEKKWREAFDTLEKARKRDLFDKQTVKRLKASVLLEEARTTMDETEKEKLVREAQETDETFVQAALLTAEYDAHRGQIRRAHKMLQKIWKLAPLWPVYETYVSLTPDISPVDAVKAVEDLISENPDAPVNDLVLADISLKAHLWGQAKTAVDKFLAANPDSKRALTIAAEIAEHNQDEKAAESYREKAAAAPAETLFRCSVCLTPFDEGFTICPVCHSMGTVTIAD